MERSGYFTISRAFFEEWAVWFTPAEWKVFCALLCDANEWGLSWHSALTISKRLNLSRDTVERALRKLDKDGFIKREVREVRGPIKLYQYRINRKKHPWSESRQRRRRPADDGRENLPLGGRKNLPLTAGKTCTARQDIPAQSNTTKKERKSVTVPIDLSNIFDGAPRSDQLHGDAFEPAGPVDTTFPYSEDHVPAKK